MGYYFVGSRHTSPGSILPSFPPDRGAAALAGDMLGQLTLRRDGGIDHGELCRSTCDRRQSRTQRAQNPQIGRLTAATHERQKINRTGDL